MESMQVKTIDGECCMKNGNMEGICRKPQSAQENAKEDPCAKDEDCSRPKAETVCICICTFQFVAPEQNFMKFDKQEFSFPTTYARLIAQALTDPFLSGPWRPPNVC